MSRIKINDGLTNNQRYRLKDLEAYRKRKKDYAKTPIEKEKRRLYQQKWREKNRERNNQLARESHSRNRHKHVDKIKNYHLLSTYGITLQDKIEMMKSQNNKCKICNKDVETTRKAHVDHDHNTGQIRGILCHVCNTKLGWFETYKINIENYLKTI